MQSCAKLIIIIFLVTSGRVFCSKRPKRIINGVQLFGRPSTYSALKYYGAITETRANPDLWDWFGHDQTIQVLKCSGSLISPSLVQSACHCFSRVNARSKGTYKIPVTTVSFFTGKWSIYFGVSYKYGPYSWETTSPVLSGKILIHQLCGKIENSPLSVYDFSLIQVSPRWWNVDNAGNYPKSEIQFAPYYTADDIAMFSVYAVSRQLVCLILGFGSYIMGRMTSSDQLLTGWTYLMSNQTCTNVIGEFDKRQYGLYTWSCGVSFSKHLQGGGEGDSGGPVTCNDRFYASMMARRVSKADHSFIVTLVSPLVYNLFVNAIDYRDDLMRSLFDLVVTYKDQTFMKEQLDFHPIKPRTFLYKQALSFGRFNQASSFTQNFIWVHVLKNFMNL